MTEFWKNLDQTNFAAFILVIFQLLSAKKTVSDHSQKQHKCVLKYYTLKGGVPKYQFHKVSNGNL